MHQATADVPAPLAGGRPRLVVADEAGAYYEAQRRAARARVRDDRAGFYHWAKVAAEVARIAPLAEMNIDVVRAVVADEERRKS